MCGCIDLTCAGGCGCGCSHNLKMHDRALRWEIAKVLMNEISQHKCNHTYCINRLADQVMEQAVQIVKGESNA